jgi:hypothetical protein
LQIPSVRYGGTSLVSDTSSSMEGAEEEEPKTEEEPMHRGVPGLLTMQANCMRSVSSVMAAYDKAMDASDGNFTVTVWKTMWDAHAKEVKAVLNNIKKVLKDFPDSEKHLARFRAKLEPIMVPASVQYATLVKGSGDEVIALDNVDGEDDDSDEENDSAGEDDDEEGVKVAAPAAGADSEDDDSDEDDDEEETDDGSTKATSNGPEPPKKVARR